jgi:hypothetical protein
VTDRAGILGELTSLLTVGHRNLPLAHRLAAACRDMLQVNGVSLTVEVATPNRVTLAATDQVAAELEQLQDVLEEGPCWDAYLTGSPQVANLTEFDDRRWPRFSPAAREAVGPRAVYGLPMRPEQETLGVLSAHLPSSTELSTVLEDALFLADTVGAALLLDPQQHDPNGLAGPWSGRSQIHQATGMIIAQLSLPAADALALMRAHAFAHNTTLDDIAEQLITRRLDFGKDPQ